MTGGSTRSPGPAGPEARWWSPFRKAEGRGHPACGPRAGPGTRGPGLRPCWTGTRSRGAPALSRTTPGVGSPSAGRRCASASPGGWDARTGNCPSGTGSTASPTPGVNGSRVAASFNVSHSGPHGLIAFSEHAELGVDVEERVLRRDFEDLGEAVLGPRERKALTALRGRDQAHLFFRIWTHERGADQGPRHRLFPEPGALRSAAGDAPRRPGRGAAASSRSIAPMAAPRPGRTAVRRRGRLAAAPFEGRGRWRSSPRAPKRDAGRCTGSG